MGLLNRALCRIELLHQPSGRRSDAIFEDATSGFAEAVQTRRLQMDIQKFTLGGAIMCSPEYRGYQESSARGHLFGELHRHSWIYLQDCEISSHSRRARDDWVVFPVRCVHAVALELTYHAN